MAASARNKKNSRPSSRATQKRPVASARKGSGRGTGAKTPWLDARNVRDIIGVLISACGLALFVAVVSTHTGVAALALARALGYAFGVGRFVFPLIMLIWGLSFFIPRIEIEEGRIGLGFAILLVTFVSLVALLTPGRYYLVERLVSSYGGYVGGGLAWCLHSLLGTAIAAILLVAVFLIGLIICGLSFSALTERISAWREERRLLAQGLADPENLHDDRTMPAPVRRARRSSGAVGVGALPFDTDPGAADGDAANVKTRKLGGRGAEKTIAIGAHGAEGERGAAAAGEGEPAVAPAPASAPKAPVSARSGAVSPDFKLPPLSLLRLSQKRNAAHARDMKVELEQTATTIVDTLQTFGVPARVVDWICGPTVTLFKVDIAKGVRTNRITALTDDLALALAASTIRIMAPIPGESLIGIEVPNERRSSVTLGDVLSQTQAGEPPLTLAIGKDVSGKAILRDLAKMPHVLIGGTTGSGKSVAINAMLMSILMRATPDEVRLVLVDPKRVELSTYNGIPHLYVPVVTDPKEAASALAWAVTEMERRLKTLQKAGARNVNEYYRFLEKSEASTDGRPDWAGDMPLLVIVIDELADLMMAAGKEVEQSIVRLAQLGRAGGIHLIVATQRPDANIVTPLIKANITNRIAFNVPSAIDSRVILGQSGAETLTGLGDMLFLIPEWPKPKRIQGCFVSEEEVSAVAGRLKHQAEPDYHEEILRVAAGSAGGAGDEGFDDDDPLLWEAAQMVVSAGMGSTSGVQRRFRVGYSRAGRIMDMLEQHGIVGPPDGSKPREVLVTVQELDQMLGAGTGTGAAHVPGDAEPDESGF
ncbi:MAG: DNA translocase FtsK [Coriobacteriia bacterium]|nr:DNA translocase FtsK [Coriobacteriia bacterium]